MNPDNKDQLYHEGFLESILENFHNIDILDQYQVYCLFRLIDAECCRCGEILDLVEPFSNAKDLVSGSSEWCRAASLLMRANGWIVPAPNEGWYKLEAICPKCDQADRAKQEFGPRDGSDRMASQRHVQVNLQAKTDSRPRKSNMVGPGFVILVRTP